MLDAVVIGTGFGGAVSACRLAQADLKVCVLERGRRYPKGTFPRNWKDPAAGWLWSHGRGLYALFRFLKAFVGPVAETFVSTILPGA